MGKTIAFASLLNKISGFSLSVCARTHIALVRCWRRGRGVLCDEKGQATTEYAILVGVLVVMAIIAIALFRPRLQELWNAIAEGINGL